LAYLRLQSLGSHRDVLLKRVQAAGKLFESARLGFERAQVDLAVLQEQADELEAKINDQSLLLAEIDTRMATLQSLMSSPQKK